MSNSKSVKKYDFIFGIGRACACSQSLRLAGLQLLSLPWDWITMNSKEESSSLPARLDIMESGFSDWLEEKDLEFVSHLADNGKDQYRNRRYGIVYPHDFPRDVPLHESYPAVKEKYDRRVARFKRLMAEANECVLAVYMDTPVSPPADVAVCKETQRRLQALYPHIKIDFLMISLEYGRSFDNRTVEDLGDGFTRVAFDFKDYGFDKFDFSVDLRKCAAVMKSIASVRDYRSRAEIKAMVEKTRLDKMRAAGADNAWQYFWIRRRRELARMRDLSFPRLMLARMRRKKFDHVLSLGMNCEPAFRFSLSWGFVDSTPFAWSTCGNPLSLADVIRNPGHIGCDGFSWEASSLMWKCNKSGISFHGKLAIDPRRAVLPPDVLDADRAELIQRMAYLNDKFTRILSDNSSKALIYRVSTKVALAGDVTEKIEAVQRSLEDRGAKNYTLVVVVERKAKGRIPPGPNRLVRIVNAFNPVESVVKPKLGDPIGWRALFTEITPAKILPKKHAFKFEKG